MKRTATLAGALLAVLLSAAGPVHATCGTGSKPYFSGRLRTPGVNGTAFYVTSPDVDGVWWALGFGDPDPGEGIDSGTYPGGGCNDGNSCWIHGPLLEYYGYSFLYYPSINGRWLDPRIDGCIDNEPAANCLAALLSDEVSENGYFALLTAPKETSNIEFFEFNGASLAPIPPPAVAGTTESAASLRIQVAPVTVPPAGLVTKPACTTGLVQGFRVYQQVREQFEPPPGRRREEGWQLAIGGALPNGVPLPNGSAASITATDCADFHNLYLATGLVFEGGFETLHVSADSHPIPCGACLAVDGDGDAFRADKCAVRADFDCDDAAASVYPGAPQACDGLNNDCRHPGWPLLEGTGEIDDDGDGLSQCAGDPCPFDADDDGDADGRCADLDNCPSLHNPGQENADGDGAGDLCDPCPFSAPDDADRDSTCGNVDNCPVTYNPAQENDDGDLRGNVCDPCRLDPDDDIDHDGRCANVDICPIDPFNDFDRDGLCANVDPCPFDTLNDGDADGFCGDVDNCPVDNNPDQADAEGDGQGDACDVFALPGLVTREGSVERRIDVDTGDIDGDGDIDIVAYGAISTFTQTDLLWFANLGGAGAAWSRRQVTVLPPTSGEVEAGDLNGDGRLDIVIAGQWFENRPGSWVSHPHPATLPGMYCLADLDGDGDLDIVETRSTSIGWYQNDGSGGGWSPHVIDTRLSSDPAPADVDGDGDLDLFARVRKQVIEYVWYENVAGDAGAWSEHGIDVSTTTFGELSGGDVDGDGDIDLMATDGGVLWLENKEATRNPWVRHVIADSSNPPIHISIHAVDIDRDGDLDALTSTERSVGIGWHENTGGDGSSWKPRTIQSTNGLAGNALVTGAFDADIDSDGRIDAIGTGMLAGLFGQVRIQWYRNLSTGTVVADAGPDQAVPCAGPGGTAVTLDASGSSTPLSSPTYVWTGPFGTITTAAPTTVVTIPPGTHVVGLRVLNAWNASDEDSVTITVQPFLSLSPELLWPPNHRLVDVTASIGVCAGGVVLKSITSSESADQLGGGDGATAQDIQGAVPGTADMEFRLRSERSPSGPGRVYMVTYETTAGTGPPVEITATVVVPRDRSGGPEPIDLTVSQNGAGTVLSWTDVPDATSYSAIRGSLGTFQAMSDRVVVGSVVCLQTGPSTSTAGAEDAPNPPAGEGFFYAVGYDDVRLRSAYGTVWAELPLTIESGDCPHAPMSDLQPAE